MRMVQKRFYRYLKKHLIMLEYILVSQPKYSTRGDAFLCHLTQTV